MRIFIKNWILLGLIVVYFCHSSLAIAGGNKKGKDLRTKNNLEQIEQSRKFQERQTKSRDKKSLNFMLHDSGEFSRTGILLHTLLLVNSLAAMTPSAFANRTFKQNEQNFTGLSKLNNTNYQEPCNTQELINSVPTIVKNTSIFFQSTFASKAESFLANNGDCWAQEMVQVDAMKSRVNQILQSAEAKSTTVPIVVLDDGFKPELEKYFSSNGTVITRKINKSWPDNYMVFKYDATEENYGRLDQEYHGVSVAALISGKDGIGMIDSGISLSVYKFWTFQSNNGDLLKQAEIACLENQDPSGLTIINLSAGDPTQDQGVEPVYNNFGQKINMRKTGKDVIRDEILYIEQIEELGRQGCLVVTSAGNDAYRGPHVNQLTDAYLRVEAMNKDKRVADSSSVGEVGSPGVEVLTLTVFEDTWIDETVVKYAPKTGTSFAAPIVTGIIAQAIRVLKSAPYFSQLTNAERISLVTTIIKHSEIDGVVNGLRAVQIAQSWNEISSIKSMPLDPKWVSSI